MPPQPIHLIKGDTAWDNYKAFLEDAAVLAGRWLAQYNDVKAKDGEEKAREQFGTSILRQVAGARFIDAKDLENIKPITFISLFHPDPVRNAANSAGRTDADVLADKAKELYKCKHRLHIVCNQLDSNHGSA